MNPKLMKNILEFRDKRNWEQFHTGANLAKSLIIEAAELLELFQWDNDLCSEEELKDELADVLIYAFLIADKYNLDVESIILNKIEKNKKKYPVDKSFGTATKYTKL